MAGRILVGEQPRPSAEPVSRARTRRMHAAPLHCCLSANVIVLLTFWISRSVGTGRRRGRRRIAIGNSIRHAGNLHVRVCLVVVARPMRPIALPYAPSSPLSVAFLDDNCLFPGIPRRTHGLHNTFTAFAAALSCDTSLLLRMPKTKATR
jgi:hypothetical protein